MSNFLGEYVVWNPLTGKTARVHPARAEAEKEARRLAQGQAGHGNGEVYVCKLVTVVYQAPPKPPVTMIRAEDRGL
jgi:hypothetical protein